MRLWIYIILMLLLCLRFFGQTPKQDSLKLILYNPKEHDSIRFDASYAIFMDLFREDLDTARTFAVETLEFPFIESNKTYKATMLRLIGNTHAIKGNYNEALVYFMESHDLHKSLGDKRAMGLTFNNIGTIYYELGNYTKALDYQLQGLKISEELDDKANLARLTNNLGNVFIRQNNLDKALEYLNYSLKLKQELGDKPALVHTYNNVGLVYKDLRQYELAFKNLTKSAELAEEVKDLRGYARAYGNMGEVFSMQGKFDKSLEYLNRAIEVAKEVNDEDGLTSSFIHRGAGVYLNTNKFLLAKEDCERSLELATAMNALMAIKASCECLSIVWAKLGRYDKSLEYYKRSVSAKDSLFNNEKTQEITRQEMTYQFERQKLADSIAFTNEKAKRELQYAKDLSKQRNKVNLLVFGFVGILIIGGIYWRSRQKSIKLKREREVIARLKQVDQLKDQFLANTSHELRTPLNGIIGLSESLKDGAAGQLSNKAMENLEMITNSGKRLSNLVNDILDFSKLKNKDLILSIQPVDVYAIADLVIKVSKNLAKDKNIDIINTIPKDIKLVQADENRLQQILYNLIGNSIKFTETGQVEVNAVDKNSVLFISVKDSGIGIPENKLDSIFKSFEQVDGSIQRQYGGAGLGLSVTKQLVELHKGEIFVDSEIGKGSTFTFTLPVSNTQRDEIIDAHFERSALINTRQPEDLPVESEEFSFKESDVNILIVDDEHINRRVLENHLTNAGYRVVEANNGRNALKFFEGSWKFDLVLLDIMMPNMSGYEVCEIIRKQFLSSELPIIMLTAKNRVSDLVAGFNVGANDYLTKPFSKSELLSRIKTHLNLSRIHKATSKFVPSEFLKSVGREVITDVVLGDHIEKEVTVLFTDVRNYTTLSETMTPEQNFKFVNAYVGRMGPIIQNNNGFVNQFLGDGIMALFPQKANDALKASIAMQRTVSEYNLRRVKEGYKPITVGMGMHTGDLVMGIIGDKDRNDTAIIADTVNTASRMEGLTKFYGAKIVISEGCFADIQNIEDFNFRYLGKVKVKGKNQPIGVYECFDGDEEDVIALKIETLEDFQKGLTYFFNREFPKASGAFDNVLIKNPEDLVAKYFLNRSAQYTISGTPPDWDMVNIVDNS